MLLRLPGCTPALTPSALTRLLVVPPPLPPPGKTRCINHFFINGAWYLVDLPGYGWVGGWQGKRGGDSLHFSLMLPLTAARVPPLRPSHTRSYAKAGKSNVIEWNTFTRQYFLERETLVT